MNKSTNNQSPDRNRDCDIPPLENSLQELDKKTKWLTKITRAIARYLPKELRKSLYGLVGIVDSGRSEYRQIEQKRKILKKDLKDINESSNRLNKP